MCLRVSTLGVCAHINEDAKQSSSLALPILFLETGFLTKSGPHRFGYLYGLANCLCTPGLVTEAYYYSGFTWIMGI